MIDHYKHPFKCVVCTNCGHTHTFMVECIDRTCPQCQTRRRQRIIARFKPIVMLMPNAYFVTLTYVRKNLTQHLVMKARKDFTKLRHRKRWKARGGIYQIEVGSLDEWGQCNLHIHVIADFFKRQVDLDIFASLSSGQKKRHFLSVLWRSITGDSFIVDVKRCHNSKNILKHYLTTHMAKRIGSPKQASMINKALQGTRLIQGFGDLHRVKVRFFEVICPHCHAKDSYVADFDAIGPQNPPETRPGTSLQSDHNIGY